jgi:hypothetical protein
MTEAKLAPNLPCWMEGHTNRELFSGGTELDFTHFWKRSHYINRLTKIVDFV